MTQLIDEEEPGTRGRLPDRLGPPVFDRLDVQEIVAQLGLVQGSGITIEVIHDEPELPVIGLPGAGVIVAQRQPFGILGHGSVAMLILQRIRPAPSGVGPVVKGQGLNGFGGGTRAHLGLAVGGGSNRFVHHPRSSGQSTREDHDGMRTTNINRRASGLVQPASGGNR